MELCQVQLCQVQLCQVQLCQVQLCQVQLCQVQLCQVQLCQLDPTTVTHRFETAGISLKAITGILDTPDGTHASDAYPDAVPEHRKPLTRCTLTPANYKARPGGVGMCDRPYAPHVESEKSEPMKNVLVAVGLLSLVLGGCEDSGSGIGVICNAPVECQDCEHRLWSGRITMLARHIDGNLNDEAARALFDEMATHSFAENAETLRAAATEAGIDECPMVEVYRSAEHGDDGTLGGY